MISKEKEESLSQILILYLKKKIIGLFPAEIYNTDINAIQKITASCVSVEQALSEIVPDEMSETLSEESEPKVVGFLIQHGHDDYSYWEGFSLTEEEKEQLSNIFLNHDTEGCSVRGRKKDVVRDMLD